MQEDKIVSARPLRRDRYEALLAYAEALARVAAGGGGAQALAAHLAASIDAAVLVEDAQWRHLAVAGTGERAIPPSVRDLLHKDADGDEPAPLRCRPIRTLARFRCAPARRVWAGWRCFRRPARAFWTNAPPSFA